MILADRARKYNVYFLTLIAVLSVDQLSKLLIIKNLSFSYGYTVIPIIDNFLYFTHVHNTGAAWSILEGKQYLLCILGFIALAAVWLYRDKLELQKKSNQLYLGLFCGGVIGNIIDRLLWGYVIDFIDIHLVFYRWPTFNIADSGIVIGALAYSIWSPKNQ